MDNMAERAVRAVREKEIEVSLPHQYRKGHDTKLFTDPGVNIPRSLV